MLALLFAQGCIRFSYSQHSKSSQPICGWFLSDNLAFDKRRFLASFVNEYRATLGKDSKIDLRSIIVGNCFDYWVASVLVGCFVTCLTVASCQEDGSANAKTALIQYFFVVLVVFDFPIVSMCFFNHKAQCLLGAFEVVSELFKADFSI